MDAKEMYSMSTPYQNDNLMEYHTATLKGLLCKIMNNYPDFAKVIGDDLSEDPYGIDITQLAALLLTFHSVKDAGYGRSWAKRGASGVYQNVLRKADRLETLAVLNLSPERDDAMGVALVDTIVDLSIYCMMWACYVAKTDKDIFATWMRTEWCVATGIPYEDVEELFK